MPGPNWGEAPYSTLMSELRKNQEDGQSISIEAKKSIFALKSDPPKKTSTGEILNIKQITELPDLTGITFASILTDTSKQLLIHAVQYLVGAYGFTDWNAVLDRLEIISSAVEYDDGYAWCYWEPQSGDAYWLYSKNREAPPEEWYGVDDTEDLYEDDHSTDDFESTHAMDLETNAFDSLFAALENLDGQYYLDTQCEMLTALLDECEGVFTIKNTTESNGLDFSSGENVANTTITSA